MRIEGSFEVDAPRPAVFRYITDAGLMARCVPGCESIEAVSPTMYRAVVAIGIGMIQARFNLTVEITREDPPSEVLSRTRGEEGSRASMLSADNEVRLIEISAVLTRVEYVSEVSLTGRLGKFALGVMRKKVESLSVDFARNFRKEIQAGAGASV